MELDDFMRDYYIINDMLTDMSVEQLNEIIKNAERIKNLKKKKNIISEMKMENAKRQLGIV